jgi:hypothetical protein
MTVLELMCPYLGDDLESTAEDKICFLVYQIEGGQHIIMDQEVCEDEFIATHLLFEEDFNLPKWYAEHHVGTEEVELLEDHPWVESPTMGRVLEWGILHTLQESEQLYPQREDNISVDKRWMILSDSDRFHVWDWSLMCVISVAHACLLDFEFDLINWYLSSVKRQLTKQTAMDGSHSDWTEGSNKNDSWTLTSDRGGTETVSLPQTYYRQLHYNHQSYTATTSGILPSPPAQHSHRRFTHITNTHILCEFVPSFQTHHRQLHCNHQSHTATTGGTFPSPPAQHSHQQFMHKHIPCQYILNIHPYS